MLVLEEYIEGNLFQIFDESIAPETFNPDLHEETLIHVASYFEDVRLQFDHHELQESSEIEEVVLESLAHDDFPLDSENEECSCISANFQDMVMFQILIDPFANLL